MSRMGRAATVASTLGLVLALAAGCGSGATSSSAQLPTASGSNSNATTGTTHHQSLVGSCHLVAAKAFRVLVDTSSAVPCSHRHNVETAGVHPVYDKVTAANLHATVHGYLGDCYPDYLNYLKLQDYKAIRVLLTPLGVKRPDGSWVVRCDLYLESSFATVLPAATSTTSLHSQATSGDTASWDICFDRPPSGHPPLVDCTRPHRFEAVTTYQTLTALNDVYPTAPQLLTRGKAQCRRAVASRADAGQLDVIGHWQSRRIWVNGGRPTNIYGTCYLFRSDHRDLPPVH